MFGRKKRKQEQVKKRQAPVIESLEPRILLSADLPGFDLPDADFDAIEDADVDHILAQAEEAFLNQQQAAEEQAAQQQSDTEQVEEPDVALATHEPQEPLRQELVIVDPSVEDHETLLFDMQPVGGDSAELRIVYLDPQRSGIDQISEILSTRSDLDAIPELVQRACWQKLIQEPGCDPSLGGFRRRGRWKDSLLRTLWTEIRIV